MTFVKFDPEGVQALINNLYAYVEDTDEGRSAIYWASDDRDHPVPTVEEMTSAPALYSCAPADGVSATTMGNAAAILLEVADDLAARRREIIDLNSSGVTAAAPDGRLTYYLPDDAEDTITNLRSYNTEAATAAGADAAALTQAKDSENGTADDGRTTDQILTDIANHQDNPAYGAAFIKAAGGAQAYLDLVEDLNDYYCDDYDGDDAAGRFTVSTATLGRVLAAASRSDSGGELLAEDLHRVIEDKGGAPGYMVALNMMLSAPEAVYDTDFLIGLAGRLESRDPNSMIPPTMHFINGQAGTSDPLTGVLTAMSSNPEAALEYLAPAKDGSVDDAGNWVPSQTATERWELLTSRDRNIQHQDAAEALSAATAAASSFRNRAPSADDPVPADADARATCACGRAITYFAGEAFSKDDITDAMKQNLAVMAANSPEEIITIAEGGKLDEGSQGPGLANWGVTKADISTLVYRLGDDKDAMATLATGMGEFHHDRIQEAMTGSDAGTMSLASEYQQAAASSAYIRSLSESRFTDDGAEGSADLVASLADRMRLRLDSDPHDPHVWVGDAEVTAAIREPRIALAIRHVSTNLRVRAWMAQEQRRRMMEARAQGSGMIAEGRDITTVVCPDADVRVLLLADEEARLRRRTLELYGDCAPEHLEAVREQVQGRDRADSAVTEFMKPAPGVRVVDSTGLDIEGVTGAVLALVDEDLRTRGA